MTTALTAAEQVLKIVAVSLIDSQGRTWDYQPRIADSGISMECPRHGAMSCVSANLKIWRCLTCEVGCVVERANAQSKESAQP